jgi:hypothetical protein
MRGRVRHQQASHGRVVWHLRSFTHAKHGALLAHFTSTLRFVVRGLLKTHLELKLKLERHGHHREQRALARAVDENLQGTVPQFAWFWNLQCGGTPFR